jgi:hypothetical protein
MRTGLLLKMLFVITFQNSEFQAASTRELSSFNLQIASAVFAHPTGS